MSPSAAQDDIVSPATAQDGIPSPGAPTGGEHALVQEEEKEVGVVAFSVYLAYWRAVGTVLAPAVFLALFLMQGECSSMLIYNILNEYYVITVYSKIYYLCTYIGNCRFGQQSFYICMQCRKHA